MDQKLHVYLTNAIGEDSQWIQKHGRVISALRSSEQFQIQLMSSTSRSSPLVHIYTFGKFALHSQDSVPCRRLAKTEADG